MRRPARSLGLACAGLLVAAGAAGARERYATPDPPAHEPLSRVRSEWPAGRVYGPIFAKLPRGDGPRRVVILVDAPESANSMSEFRSAGRDAEAVSVLEAERCALDHLLDLSQDDWLEIGVIAFGETTWRVALSRR